MKEQRALQWLKNRPDLIIKPADKGGNIVILSETQYMSEAKRQLCDERVYIKLKSDPTISYQSALRSILRQGVEKGFLSHKFADKLLYDDPARPYCYFLPKVHKSLKDPPGRPRVAGRGSVTEPVSRYLDWLLRPILNSVPAFLKDTKDFLNMLELFPVQSGDHLACIDVESLYTRIPTGAGVEAVRRQLHRFGYVDTFIDYVCELLLFVLDHNSFQFNQQWYRQCSGTAIGTPVAPTFANIFLAMVEEEIIYNINNPYLQYIRLYTRYIDDAFIIWSGTQQHFCSFMEYLNHNPYNMSFTYNFGDNTVNFLDVTVNLECDGIVTKGYRKETAVNSLLDYDSYHPSHVKTSLPYGQFIRLRRNNSNEDTYSTQCEELTLRLIQRGYPLTLIKKAKQKADKINRRQLLHYNSRKNKRMDRFVFNFQYSPMDRAIKQAIFKHWNIIQEDPLLKNISKEKPLISFRRCPNLRDILVKGRFLEKRKTNNWLNDLQGNRRCGNCRYCNFLMCTNTVMLGMYQHRVKDLITCRTKFVVYAIICDCQKYYIGKTIRPMYVRFSEHVRSLKTGIGSPKLIAHMQKYHEGNPNKMHMVGLLCVPPIPSGQDRNKELLRQETVIILKAEALGPLGLNERRDLSVT